MATYQYRGKQGQQYQLKEGKDTIVIRSKRKLPINMLPLSKKGRALMGELRSVVRFPEAGVEVLSTNSHRSRDEVRKELKKEDALRFAGRTLVDPKSKAPVIYTENFFVKFEDDASKQDCKKILQNYGLQTKRAVDYAHNAFIVNAEEGVWGCTLVGYCSEVCPKSVDPAAAVNRNKVESTTQYFLRFLVPRGNAR